MLADAGSGAMSAVTSYMRGDLGGVFKSVTGVGKKMMNGNSAEQKTRQTKTVSLLTRTSLQGTDRLDIWLHSLMLIALRGVDVRTTKLPLMLQKLVKLQEQCHGHSFLLSVSSLLSLDKLAPVLTPSPHLL